MQGPVPSAEACPNCGGEEVTVADSRPQRQGRIRRRRCLKCNFRWTTLEVILLRDVTTLEVREAIMKALVLTNELWSLLERSRDLLGGVPVPTADEEHDA